MEQQVILRNEYLAAENRILKAQLKTQLPLTDAERITLAEIAHRLGRKALEDVANVVKPDTLLGWYRRLIARTLARHAQIIPALATRDPAEDRADLLLLQISIDDVENYPLIRGRELQRVSRARVRLAASENCEFIVYRERFGDAEHVAIVIDTPDSAKPVPVRLHSACLSGDLLASLRCDCGDQLRGAVERIAKLGGVVVVYLAQQGRGIDRVVLLTNNPNKIAALDVCEIEVVSRMPLPAPANTHNEHYCAPNGNTPVIWQSNTRAQRTSDSWFDRPVLQAC